VSAVQASSRLVLRQFPADSEVLPLESSVAMLLPVAAGPLPMVCFLVEAQHSTALEVEVRGSSVAGNYTPDVTIYQETVGLEPGGPQQVWLRPDFRAAAPAYFSYCLMCNPAVSVHTSSQRVTGIVSLSQSMNRAVAKSARQEPPPGIGIDTFEFWLPTRRPVGRNLAIRIDPPLDVFGPENVRNGIARPTLQPNAWVASPDDPAPRLSFCWSEPRRVGCIELTFDTDFDHPMESVLMGHPEREIPFCVKRYRIVDGRGGVLFECMENHQTRNTIRLEPPAHISALHIEILETRGAPAAIFEARFYES